MASKADSLDAGDDGHEHDGEEGADVEDFQLFEEVPGEVEDEDHGKEEDDVAAGDVAAALGIFNKKWLIGWQVVLLWTWRVFHGWMPTFEDGWGEFRN